MTDQINELTPLFDGVRDLQRRKKAASGEWVDLIDQNTGRPFRSVRFGKYVKTVPTYAVQIPYDYEVKTLEGLHYGRAGTYLAVGQDGEMYPIDEGIFKTTYKDAL